MCFFDIGIKFRGSHNITVIYFIMKAFLTAFLLSASVLLAEECPGPTQCDDGAVFCWIGEDMNGCPLPNCMPDYVGCPGDCPNHPTTICPDGDVRCPMGADEFGCNFPETCMPAGQDCPHICPHHPPAECADGDRPCPMGADMFGCNHPDTCVPAGEECPHI